jgi:hypothetical protein
MPDLRIEGLLEAEFPAHLIMSEDALDVANSGFIIVRNTQWARDFLVSWWSAKDSPGAECDQHVLNNLVASLPATARAPGDPGRRLAVIAAGMHLAFDIFARAANLFALIKPQSMYVLYIV